MFADVLDGSPFHQQPSLQYHKELLQSDQRPKPCVWIHTGDTLKTMHIARIVTILYNPFAWD